MPNTLSTTGTVVCAFAGVKLIRYGPYRAHDTRYEVIEDGHVAGFSSLGFHNPLNAALCFFLDRGNLRYLTAEQFPNRPEKEAT